MSMTQKISGFSLRNRIAILKLRIESPYPWKNLKRLPTKYGFAGSKWVKKNQKELIRDPLANYRINVCFYEKKSAACTCTYHFNACT